MLPKPEAWEAFRKNLNIKFEAHTTLKKGFNLHLYNPYRLIAAHSRRLEAESNLNIACTAALTRTIRSVQRLAQIHDTHRRIHEPTTAASATVSQLHRQSQYSLASGCKCSKNQSPNHQQSAARQGR